MAAGAGRGGRARRPAGAFLRRRADGAPRSAGPGRPCPQGRALQQSHHLRRDAGPGAARALAEAGLDHVQLSIQDVDHQTAAYIANYPGVQGKKLAFARMVKEAGLPLTINAVINRHNITRVERMIDLAVDARAPAGWRWRMRNIMAGRSRNRAALMPTLRAGARGHAPRRGGARTAARPDRDRLRPAGLLRAPAEGLHGRLGPAVPQHHAQRRGAALPRRPNDSRD